MLSETQLNEIRAWLEGSQNPLFFFHNDLDGMTSFLLLQRFLGRGKGIAIKSFPGLDKNYAHKIKELGPDVIFILDAPIVDSSFLDEAKLHNIPVVWIDHHPLQKADGIHYYNPLNSDNPTHEPVSYWCYRISKKDMWIGFMGCISDAFIPEFFDDFRKEYPDLVDDVKDINLIINNTEIGKLIRLLNFAMKDTITNVQSMLRALEKTNSPQQILSREKRYESMWRRYQFLDKKFQKLFEKALEIAKDSGKVMLFKYGGEMKMSSEIGNRLIWMFPDKIIAVAHIKGDKTSVTLRGNKVRTYLEHAMKGIEGSGGGHERACAASIRVEDLPKLIEAIKKQV